MSNLTILKLGGSVITDKAANEGIANIETISRMADEISGYQGKMIIVHGAGSFGHPQAKKYVHNSRFDAVGSIITHLSVKSLCKIIVDIFNSHKINAVGIHPMCCMTTSNGRISSMFLNQINLLLEKKIVPVLHGDVVMDTHLGSAVVSGDQIVPYLATHLKASRLGIGSSTDGVLNDNNETITSINYQNFEKIKHFIKGSENTDVTGGMLGKVQEMLELSENTGITSYIFDVRKPGNIKRFLNNEKIGTMIMRL